MSHGHSRRINPWLARLKERREQRGRITNETTAKSDAGDTFSSGATFVEDAGAGIDVEFQVTPQWTGITPTSVTIMYQVWCNGPVAIGT